MESILKSLFYIVFVIAIFTGLNALVGGAASIPGVTTIADAAIDSELRCMSIFWLAYGVFCFWIARDINKRHSFIPFIALLMLLSGFARLLSILFVGLPGNALLSAIIVEFILALAIYCSYRKLEKVSFLSENR